MSTCHEIRRFTICPKCEAFGNKDDMISIDTGHWHGSCYLNRFGLKSLLRLPMEELLKLPLREVGKDVMRAILSKIEGKPNVCPVCEDSACEVKSEECGK